MKTQFCHVPTKQPCPLFAHVRIPPPITEVRTHMFNMKRREGGGVRVKEEGESIKVAKVGERRGGGGRWWLKMDGILLPFSFPPSSWSLILILARPDCINSKKHKKE